MDEGTFEGKTAVCADSIPFTGNQKIFVIVAHYLCFVTCTLGLYVSYARLDIIKQRIFSPFLLLLSFVWLQVGPAFEIGNHFYVSAWELKISNPDIINASFSFFNFGGNCLLALAVRKIGVSFLRKPNFKDGFLNGLLDIVAVVGDVVFTVTILVQTLLYNVLGRDESTSILTPVTSIAGVFTVFRVWFNLGPNNYTKYGGIFFLVFALLGVFSLGVYKEKCIEFIHVAIGGSFVFSLIPLSIAIWNAEPPSDEEDEEGVTNENTPLFKV